MKAPSESAGASAVTDSKERFSSRVENYVRYRPGYPPGVLQMLRDAYGFSAETVVADVGAGTGISTDLFLANGNTVFAVEPNPQMRAAAETAHKAKAGFHSVAASGEATTLSDLSVNLVFCAQAFHWLDRAAASREFRRIVKPGGVIAIVWNERKKSGANGFLAAYEAFLNAFATDYQSISARETEADDFSRLFKSPFRRHAFQNVQHLDFDGLKGRVLSSSYIPQRGSPRYEHMMRALFGLFNQYARSDIVDFEYETELFVSQVK